MTYVEKCWMKLSSLVYLRCQHKGRAYQNYQIREIKLINLHFQSIYILFKLNFSMKLVFT